MPQRYARKTQRFNYSKGKKTKSYNSKRNVPVLSSVRFKRRTKPMVRRAPTQKVSVVIQNVESAQDYLPVSVDKLTSLISRYSESSTLDSNLSTQLQSKNDWFKYSTTFRYV